jgi:hypothetical protein
VPAVDAIERGPRCRIHHDVTRVGASAQRREDALVGKALEQHSCRPDAAHMEVAITQLPTA